MKHVLLAALGALSAAPLAVVPAMAETITVMCEDSRPFISNTVMCLTPGVLSVRSDGPELEYFVRVTAPSTHCSDVTYSFYRRDLPVEEQNIAFSGRLAPGASENVVIGRGYPAGRTNLEVYAIGHIGDCNTGAIHSWAIDAAIAPVP
jgi:hypothetical protein